MSPRCRTPLPFMVEFAKEVKQQIKYKEITSELGVQNYYKYNHQFEEILAKKGLGRWCWNDINRTMAFELKRELNLMSVLCFESNIWKYMHNPPEEQ